MAPPLTVTGSVGSPANPSHQMRAAVTGHLGAFLPGRPPFCELLAPRSEHRPRVLPDTVAFGSRISLSAGATVPHREDPPLAEPAQIVGQLSVVVAGRLEQGAPELSP